MKNGKACYVEWDSYAAQWLRNLVSRGLIADGDVKECSVTDIVPNDLAEYSQVHLYAGIGVWSHSLRRAGIPDTANVWTFSEPCQPFSDAGKGLGFADDRYLRPYTNHLIEQCRPAICLGEQVASNDGLGWLDVVQTDMERARYACGALDTCSAGIGAPHIRQRLRVCAASEEWLADAARRRDVGQRGSRAFSECVNDCQTIGLADADKLARGQGRSITRGCDPGSDAQSRGGPGRDGVAGGMVYAERTGLEGLGRHVDDGHQPGRLGALAHGSIAAPGGFGHNSGEGRPGATNGFWRDADWLFCRDGKWRPVEPGTFPLAHGATSRVGRLRAYGNAVDAEATTAFCRAAGEVLGLI